MLVKILIFWTVCVITSATELIATKITFPSNDEPEFQHEDLENTRGLLYPRATETRKVLSLNGLWDSVKTNVSFIFNENLLAPTLQIPLPAQLGDRSTAAHLGNYIGPVWYQRKFLLPHSWRLNQRVWLRFGSINFATMIWLNGKELVSHSSGPYPFEREVTLHAKAGVENRLTLLIDNSILTAFVIPTFEVRNSNTADGQPKLYFFDYAIPQHSIFLYTTPKIFIEHLVVNTELENENLGLVHYEVSINKQPVQTEYVKVQLCDSTAEVVAKDSKNTEFKGALKVANVKPWWPYLMHPSPGYLYTLEVYLYEGDGTLIDIYRLKVGIRYLKWNDGAFSLNDKTVYLRGFGRAKELGKLDYDLWARDLKAHKWLGGNAIIASYYPYSEESLQLADENGIMIIDECFERNFRAYGTADLDGHRKSMEQLIHRDQNHASVIMWSLANSALAVRSLEDHYFGLLANYTRTLDLSRPVTAILEADFERDSIAPELDIISFAQIYQKKDYVDIISNFVVDEARTWYQIHQKPVIMAEYLTWEGSRSQNDDYEWLVMTNLFKAFYILRKEKWFVGELIWNYVDLKKSQSSLMRRTCKQALQPLSYLLREHFLNLQKCEDSGNQAVSKDPKGQSDHIGDHIGEVDEMGEKSASDPKDETSGQMEFFTSGLLLTIPKGNNKVITARFNRQSFNGDKSTPGIHGITIDAASISGEPAFKFGVCRTELSSLAPGQTIYLWYNIIDNGGSVHDKYAEFKVPNGGVKRDSQRLIKICSIPLNDKIAFFHSGVLITTEMQNVNMLTARVNKAPFNGDLLNGGIFGKTISASQTPNGSTFKFGICNRDFSNLPTGSSIYVWYNIINSLGIASDQYIEYIVPDTGTIADSDEIIKECFIPLNERVQFFRSGFKLTIPKQTEISRITVRARNQPYENANIGDVPYAETQTANTVPSLESYQFYGCTPAFKNLPIGSTIYIWYNVIKNDYRSFDQYKDYFVDTILPDSDDVKIACHIT